jgi:ppGpp synthetase/RelA/SpoT-type nucleotidyltranferase
MADGGPTGDGQIPEWRKQYESRKPAFERLASEVEFALQTTTGREGIKVHSVTSRLKSVESIAEKARSKELDDPLVEVDDVVGIRVVALFLSDLPRLDELIRSSFEIHTSEDKVNDGDPASFGYMSVHYVAVLGDQHLGPRYDDLEGIQFEIQTRTVVMDAWANVSHHLDYKGASSIPEDLRKDFFALSGLFYVADQHFEIFADRARQSQQRAKQDLHKDPDEVVAINLDTVEAFLEERYRKRRHADRASISEFVEEITRMGYTDIPTLGEALDRGSPNFLDYEKDIVSFTERHEPLFADLGAARITLVLADEKYARETRGDADDLREFAVWGRLPD